MQRGRKSLIVLALLLSVAGALIAVHLLTPPALLSDPLVPRSSKAYHFASVPPQPLLEVPADPFPLLTVKTKDQEVELVMNSASKEITSRKDEAWPSYFLLKRAQASRVQVDEGKVFLRHIAIAWATSSNDVNRSVNARFFTPDLKPVDPKQLNTEVKEWDRKLRVRGTWPEVKFTFGVTNLVHWKLLGIQMFDARTGWNLISGYSSASTPGQFHYSTECRMWHPAPVELIIFVAHGEPDTQEIPMEPGAEHHFPSSAVKIATTSPWKYRGSTSYSNGSTNRFLLTDADLASPGSTIVLQVFPDSQPLPIDFTLITEEGKDIPVSTTTSSAGMLVLQTDEPISKLRKLRLKQYPKKSRLIFSLRQLPGLPEDNRDLENLFDLKVPYVQLSRDYEFRAYLEGTLQLQMPWTFPRTTEMTYSGGPITPRELLGEYMRNFPQPKRLDVDMKTATLEFRDPLITELWNRIRWKVKNL